MLLRDGGSASFDIVTEPDYPGIAAHRHLTLAQVLGLDSEQIRVIKPALGGGAPGTVIAINEGGLHVATADGAVQIRDVQAPGRKRMHAAHT